MSFAGLGDFGGSGAPPYDQGAPAQGSLWAPGDPGAPGAPGEVRGVADFFGGGAAPGFGGGKKRTTTHPFFFLPAPACTCMQIIQMCLTLATSLYPDILPTTAGALALRCALTSLCAFVECRRLFWRRGFSAHRKFSHAGTTAIWAPTVFDPCEDRLACFPSAANASASLLEMHFVFSTVHLQEEAAGRISVLQC